MTAPGPTLPAGRYGDPRPRRSRRGRLVFIALGLALGGLLTFLAYRNLGTAPIETERTSFESMSDNRMRLVFQVSRTTPERPVVCIVRVRGLDGSEGGRKEVLVPPGEPSVRVSTVVRSTSEPVTADVFGCSYQVPAYLSTAEPPSG